MYNKYFSTWKKTKKKLNDTAIEDIRNLFRLKRNIKNLFKHEE